MNTDVFLGVAAIVVGVVALVFAGLSALWTRRSLAQLRVLIIQLQSDSDPTKKSDAMEKVTTPAQMWESLEATIAPPAPVEKGWRFLFEDERVYHGDEFQLPFHPDWFPAYEEMVGLTRSQINAKTPGIPNRYSRFRRRLS